MKTKEFKDIISQSTAKANRLILNTIECSCIPFNSWFETHSRLKSWRLFHNETTSMILCPARFLSGYIQRIIYPRYKTVLDNRLPEFKKLLETIQSLGFYFFAAYRGCIAVT